MNSDPRLGQFSDPSTWLPQFIQRFYALWREHAQDHANFEPTNGTWTPVVSFATPGTSSIVASIAVGTWVKAGKRMWLDYYFVSTPYTLGTGAGNLQITALPLAPATITNYEVAGACNFGGITKAGYSQVVGRGTTASTTMTFDASGSGVAAAKVTAADVPTGGTIVLMGSLSYRID